jgi:transcription initiation factor TFIID subunit TAF12
MADDFIESSAVFAAMLAKHRGAKVVEASDLKLHLEKNWAMRLPGFGPTISRHFTQVPPDQHFQRLEKVRKSQRRDSK